VFLEPIYRGYMLIVVFLMLLVIVPVVLGFFDRGPEWLLRPQMYLGLYLCYMANIGYKIKSMFIKKL
jgi:hypothetical protein